MGYHNILFPSADAQEYANAHLRLPLCLRRSCSQGSYVVRGNKTFYAAQANAAPAREIPVLLEDLQLGQVLDDLFARDADCDLKGIFHVLCPDEHTVHYRHEVFQALENPAVLEALEEFCRSADQSVRLKACGAQVHYAAQRDKYIIDGTSLYCSAIRRLLEDSALPGIRSEGLSGFLNKLRAYAHTPAFIGLENCVSNAKNCIDNIHYGLRITAGRVILHFETHGRDVAGEMADEFTRTLDVNMNQTGEPQKVRLFSQLELNPLEALVMDALKRRYEREFQALHESAILAEGLPEPFIVQFVHEVRFYFRFIALMKQMRCGGYPFAYPMIAPDDRFEVKGAYDLALALKAEHVVDNDLSLTKDERGAIVTGANQAGKTTFLRGIGQIALLTSLGLPVPCSHARLPLYNSIFSHFSEAEDSSADHGKLKEELLRLKPTLLAAGHGSLVLLNEPFSSTTLQDATDLAGRTLSMLAAAGARIFCVSHISGLKVGQLVSMAAQVDPISRQRLYRVIRAPFETNAYADEIAKKYRLTYPEIKERIEHGI